MGLAAICWSILRIRNSVCFDNKRVKSPTEIVCMMCSFITYWAGLQKTELKQVIQGAETIKVIALYFHKDLETQVQDEWQIVPYVGQVALFSYSLRAVGAVGPVTGGFVLLFLVVVDLVWQVVWWVLLGPRWLDSLVIRIVDKS